jgi:hypothetical protein
VLYPRARSAGEARAQSSRRDAGRGVRYLLTALGSLSPSGRSLLRRDALENEREAGAHIEPPTRDHHGLVRLRAVSAGQLLSLRGRGSDIWELRHRNFYWACGGRGHAIDRGQHLLGGHVDCVSALAARNDFVGKEALKLELLPEVDSGFLRRYSQRHHRPSELCASLIGLSEHLLARVSDHVLMESDRPNDSLQGLRSTARQSEHSDDGTSHRTLPVSPILALREGARS